MGQILRNERPDLKIDWSGGRGKYGQQYVYIRPAKKCRNRSRRTTPDKVQKVIDRHFPEVNYFWIDDSVIGAPDAAAALKEFWRVCAREDIGKQFRVEPITGEHPDVYFRKPSEKPDARFT